jgi:hypothetical protein
VGAALGYLFAPVPGEESRRRLGKRLRGLRDLAEEGADELRDLVAGGEEEAEESPAAPGEDEDEAEPRSTREELERRLAVARRRRRGGGGGVRPAARADEREGPEADEPVA